MLMARITRRQAARLGLATAAALAVKPSIAHDNPMPGELREAIERYPFTPILGDPDGDITLTEFFDYNCPYCRTVQPDLLKLTKSDPELRLALREWPILGEDSVIAARISLAAFKQGRYEPFHTRLLSIRGRANEKSAMEVARDVGLDLGRVKKDMDSAEVLGHIEHSMALGDHMGLVGTPTFIAGHDGLFGKQSYKDLSALVGNARRDLL